MLQPQLNDIKILETTKDGQLVINAQIETSKQNSEVDQKAIERENRVFDTPMGTF